MKLLLDFPHGLGDAIQFTCVLRHLAKYRPDYTIFVRCLRGKHSAFTGLCNRVWHDQEPQHIPAVDKTIHIDWWENHNRYTDCPNTKVTNCLREVFHIEPDFSLLDYRVDVRQEVLNHAERYLRGIGCRGLASGRLNAVLIHYQGNTSTEKKNLLDLQASSFCGAALARGYVPVILDWDNRSPLPDQRRVFNPGCGPRDIWGGTGTGNAEILVALIARSSAFIGVDSGPQKCAGATSTPALAIWTGHHPIQYYDLSTSVTHLVPERHATIEPATVPEISRFFAKHYSYRVYSQLELAASEWIEEQLCPV